MENKQEHKAESVDPKDRFRYIGFEVFPREEKPFFASPEEKKKYVEQARAVHTADEEREFSLLFVSSFTRFDKTVLLLSSLLLIGGLFLPWTYVSMGGRWQTFFGFELFGLLGPRLADAFAVGWNAGAGAALLLLNLVLAPVLGAWLMLALLTKKFRSDSELAKLRKTVRWHALPLLVYLAVMVLAAIGFSAPDSPLLILKNGFNIFDLISSAGPGFWAVGVAHLLVAVKSADL